MPAPLVGAAVAAAARLAAKKVAQEAAKKAAKKAASKATDKIAKNSVKVKPGTKAGSMADAERKIKNAAATNLATARKSGELAKATGLRVMTGKPKGTIKINSAPAKSADAAKKAADAKALKAANKKKK